MCWTLGPSTLLRTSPFPRPCLRSLPAHLQALLEETLRPPALASWEVAMRGEHQRSPTASGISVERIPMGTAVCQAAPPTLQHSTPRKITCSQGDKSSYPHSKLLWARNVAACASSEPCMFMPSLGGDIKAGRAATASFFPQIISITIFSHTTALGSAAAQAIGRLEEDKVM